MSRYAHKTTESWKTTVEEGQRILNRPASRGRDHLGRPIGVTKDGHIYTF